MQQDGDTNATDGRDMWIAEEARESTPVPVARTRTRSGSHAKKKPKKKKSVAGLMRRVH